MRKKIFLLLFLSLLTIFIFLSKTINYVYADNCLDGSDTCHQVCADQNGQLHSVGDTWTGECGEMPGYRISYTCNEDLSITENEIGVGDDTCNPYRPFTSLMLKPAACVIQQIEDTTKVKFRILGGYPKTQYGIFDMQQGGSKLLDVSTDEKGNYISGEVDIRRKTAAEGFFLRAGGKEEILCGFRRTVSAIEKPYCSAQEISFKPSPKFTFKAAGLTPNEEYTLWLEDKPTPDVLKADQRGSIEKEINQAGYAFVLRKKTDNSDVCRIDSFTNVIRDTGNTICFANLISTTKDNKGTAKFYGYGGLQPNTSYKLFLGNGEIADIKTDRDGIFSKVVTTDFARANSFSLKDKDKQLCTFSLGGEFLRNKAIDCKGDKDCEKCVGANPDNPEGIPSALGCIKTNPAGLVGSIFGIVLGLAGGIALLLIIYSGYRMIAAAGNPEALQGARETLTSAIVGLLFIIFSFVILEIVGVDILKIPQFGQ